jgi:Leucine-rich repeat (LRR) protein
LENNIIESLSGVEHCINLRKLNVNNNEIKNYYNNNDEHYLNYNFKYWDLSSLNKLNYLSISFNKLSTIKFVNKLTSLIELYSSFNKLQKLQDIFYLKPLNYLTLIDLWSNPICNQSKYRLFII